jgi:hypothetical protein
VLAALEHQSTNSVRTAALLPESETAPGNSRLHWRSWLIPAVHDTSTPLCAGAGYVFTTIRTRLVVQPKAMTPPLFKGRIPLALVFLTPETADADGTLRDRLPYTSLRAGVPC